MTLWLRVAAGVIWISLFSVTGESDAVTISRIYGMSVDASVTTPPIACNVFAYTQQESVTLPAGFSARAITPYKGFTGEGYIVSANAAGDTVLHRFQEIPFSLTAGPVTLSTGNSPINTSAFFTAQTDSTGGAFRGQLWVMYTPGFGLCATPGCIGIIRVNGTAVVSSVLVGQRISNLYGFGQDDSNLYVLADGDGNPANTLHRVLYKIAKASGAIVGQVTLDTGNNSGGGTHNPAVNPSQTFIFASESNTDTVKKVTTAMTVVGTSGSFGNNIRALEVATGSSVEQIYGTVDVSNFFINIIAADMSGNANVLPGGETARINGVHSDPPCGTLHVAVGATAGAISIQRISPDSLAFLNTFSAAGFQGGTVTGFNYFTRRFYIGNGSPGETITAVRVST